MFDLTVDNNQIAFGDNFSLDFRRTLRIPDDGNTFPIDLGFGGIPICRVEDYRNSVPHSWLEHSGVFIPLYQREALWIYFNFRFWKPNAVKVAINGMNAVSGKSWSQKLQTKKFDYLVTPPQFYLGVRKDNGNFKQFVAMPLEIEDSTKDFPGRLEFEGIEILVYEPKKNKFPEDRSQFKQDDIGIKLMPPVETNNSTTAITKFAVPKVLSVNEEMERRIHADPHGVDTWDESNYNRVYIHIVNSMMYREITGLEPPATPVTAETYAKHNLPWFDVYDETMSDIAPSPELSQVKSIKEMDAEKGFPAQQDDDSVDLSQSDKIQYFIDNPDRVSDGDW